MITPHRRAHGAGSHLPQVRMWWRLVVVLCHILRALCDGGHGLQEQPEVQCGMENMQIIVPPHLKGDFRMKVLHKDDGKMRILGTDPSCGIWVTQKYDGSVLIGTSYDGCYVSQTDTDFVLTLAVGTKQNGGKKVTERKKMICAVETYHDAPAPGQCESVLKPNRLRCGSSQDSCASLGCCYDATDVTTPCYYGNKVTASCTPDGLFSIAISRTLTIPDLDLTSVRLLQSSSAECNSIGGNDFFRLYQFPVSSCGTTLKVIGDQAVYENQLLGAKLPRTWNGISITRDTTFRLLIRCSFAISGLLPLKVDVVTLPPPPPVSSEGPLSFDLRISLDSTYKRYYIDTDYALVKVLRDPLYVEVRLLQKSDPNLVLVVHQCWATPSSVLQNLQWPILVNGCPYTSDNNYLTELIPIAPSSAVDFPTHYSRFDVKTFNFVDQDTQIPLSGLVFIHCSVSACVPSANDNCVTVCSKRKRSVQMLRNESEAVLVSSDVPIYFENSLPEAKDDQGGIFELRTSQAKTLINGAAIAMGIVSVVLLLLAAWTLHRQRKSRSLLITKSPLKEKTVYIRTICN